MQDVTESFLRLMLQYVYSQEKKKCVFNPLRYLHVLLCGVEVTEELQAKRFDFENLNDPSMQKASIWCPDWNLTLYSISER